MKSRALTILATLIGFLVLQQGLATATEPEAVRSNNSYGSINELVGKDVHGTDDLRMGIVKDVFISPDGKHVYFILVRGSAFGEIGPYLPIPWQLADPHIRDGRVYISFNRDMLKGAPGVAVEDWPPTVLAPELRKEVREFYQEAARL
jgi:sporulation protein YlmC with PRC-barrel domain